MKSENVPVFQQQQVPAPAPALSDAVKSRSLNGLFEDLLTTLLTLANLLSQADKSHRSIHIHSCKHTPIPTVTGYHTVTHSTSIFSISH